MGLYNSEYEVGFAKLQGEDFEYYMQTYSMVLGRNTKDVNVDVDLSIFGDGMKISRQHARIFYDFKFRCFALEIISKKGCSIKGVLYYPEDSPIKLDSQDLLQIGDKKFYFLLPKRSILVGSTGPSKMQIMAPNDYNANDDEKGEEDGYNEDDAKVSDASKKLRPQKIQGLGNDGNARDLVQLEQRSAQKPRFSRETDDNQVLELEEKNVISCVAKMVPGLCGPGQWVPLAKLHNELLEQYGSIWHHSKVRRYLTSEERPTEKPWFGLLALLRKYPEYFLISTRSKSRVTTEFVSLVS